MEAMIPSLLSSANDSRSLLLLLFLFVTTGVLVPRWRYNELKEELAEYERNTKTIMSEFRELVAKMTKDGVSPADEVGEGHEKHGNS